VVNLATNHDDSYEDRRLVRLGIDPDGDPLENLRKLRQIQRGLGDQPDETGDEDDDAADSKGVSDRDNPTAK